ncbi:MAG: polysaccharide deacetylase family protein [Thermodesulfobacteriota bacterium]
METDHSHHIEAISIPAHENIMSVDVECWDQIICRNLTRELIHPTKSCLESTRSLLDLFKKRGVKATFFVLGYVAETFPDLIRRIDAEGHEVAAHGYTHTPLRDLTREKFEEELDKTVGLLTRIVRKRIHGFRAPEFSITKNTLWALDTLVEYGFTYDSSIMPLASSRYGIDGFPLGPSRVHFGESSILEVPPSTVHLLGRRIPAAGGRYLRLLPYQAIRGAVRQVNREVGPYVLYLHPYELSAERLTCGAFPGTVPSAQAWKTEFLWNWRRESIRGKLLKLLDEFRFSPVIEVLARAIGN